MFLAVLADLSRPLIVQVAALTSEAKPCGPDGHKLEPNVWTEPIVRSVTIALPAGGDGTAPAAAPVASAAAGSLRFWGLSTPRQAGRAGSHGMRLFVDTASLARVQASGAAGQWGALLRALAKAKTGEQAAQLRKLAAGVDVSAEIKK